MDKFVKSKYEGDQVEGLSHGLGVYTFPDGSRYEGEFSKGNFHGQGKIVYPNGNCVEGTWNEGVLTQRKMIFADGLEYAENDWNYCEGEDRRFQIERLTEIKPLDQTLLSNDPNGLKPIKPGHYGAVTRDSEWRI